MSSTNRGGGRAANDYYATPDYAFKPLLALLPSDVTFFEPCAGDGRLIRWLRESDRKAHGSDLFPLAEAGSVYPGFPTDFLADTRDHQFILTNPPFSLAVAFFDHALKHAPEVMMLQRLNYLATRERHAWWCAHEPDALFVLSVRPDFDGRGGDSTDYCWYYWGPRWKGIWHLLGEKPRKARLTADYSFG